MFSPKNILTIFSFILITSCHNDDILQEIPNSITFEQKLSEYQLFTGPLKNLIPADNVLKYDLNTELFTDYAEKLRFIKLPKGKKLRFNNDSSPDFPNGTILVKTFYYSANSLIDTDKDKIIETRLLILVDGKWNVGVYQWNNTQTEAYLIENGAEERIRSVLPNGSKKEFTYKIPSNMECTTCHNNWGDVTPIGPTVHNLNKITVYNNKEIHQLKEWMESGLLEYFELNPLNKLPEWNNKDYPINQRARAYMEVNCAHCHNPSGVASNWRLDLRFSTPFNETGIDKLKHHIPARMNSNWSDEIMPRLGTSLKHTEGIDLMIDYVNQLNSNR